MTDRMARPWDRQCGLQDADLVQAVVSGELDPIRRLWQEAKVLEWVGDCDDDLCRFLTVVHHVATAVGLHCRMAALVSRVKRGIDVSKTRHASEDWAAAVMRRRHAMPAMATP